MKHILLLIFALGIVCGLTNPATADTLILKSGAKIEGDIVSETDTTIVIEMTMSGGSLMRRTVNKSEIADITRETPEQKRERALLRDWKQLMTYQLSPTNQYTVAYYDQVIQNVFQSFVNKYPDAPQTADVRKRMELWEQEKQQVQAGNVKYQGRWMPAEEARLAADRARIAQWMTEGRAHLEQKNFERAIQRFEAVVEAKPDAQTEAEAKKLAEQAYRDWQTHLTAIGKRVEAQLQQVTETVKISAESRQIAVEQYTAALASYNVTGGEKLGARAELAMRLNELKKQDAELERLNQSQKQLEQQLEQIKALTPKIEAKLEAYRVASLPPKVGEVVTPVPARPVPAPLPPIEVPSVTNVEPEEIVLKEPPAATRPPAPLKPPDDAYTKLVNWLEDNWLPAILVGLVIMGFLMRMLRK